MSNWNPNSAKHKANHGGYREKPTRSQVKANLDFWALLKNSPADKVVTISATSGVGKPGGQLKLNF